MLTWERASLIHRVRGHLGCLRLNRPWLIVQLNHSLYRERAARTGSTVTSWVIVGSERKMPCRDMRFICGHKLHGRMNSTLEFYTETLSLIEHFVIMTTLRGCSSRTKFAMAAVEPAKSALATTSGGHSGWASTTMPGCAIL